MAGKITALQFQKRTDERINVFLDGQYAFPLAAVVAAALRPGQNLSDDDIARLTAADEAEQAYERAVNFLAYRPRSVAEVRRYLRKRSVPQEAIDGVIERLSAAGYLDDAGFAQFWVSDRERFNPRSSLALRQELRNKGVSNQTIDEALRSLDGGDSAYRAGSDRARRIGNLDEQAFRQKLGGYLLRRGFPHDVVWPVVGRLWRELHGQEQGEDHEDWPESRLE